MLIIFYSLGAFWLHSKRFCAYTDKPLRLLIVAVLTLYIPMIAILVIYTSTLVIATSRKKVIGPSIRPKNRQKERIRITRCYFMMSAVHIVCLTPNVIAEGGSITADAPFLTVISRPLHSLAYTICPVNKVWFGTLWCISSSFWFFVDHNDYTWKRVQRKCHAIIWMFMQTTKWSASNRRKSIKDCFRNQNWLNSKKCIKIWIYRWI